jgi:heme/copper-type cytochrome/quinol oxidase subunit 2
MNEKAILGVTLVIAVVAWVVGNALTGSDDAGAKLVGGMLRWIGIVTFLVVIVAVIYLIIFKFLKSENYPPLI